MGVKTVEDLLAFQLAVEFKLEVYRLVRGCPQAIDYKYQSQLFDAASGVEANLAEGFKRNVPGEFFQFVRYAAASLAEARTRLGDGIHREYFSQEDCRAALSLGKRSADAVAALQRSLSPFLKRNRDSRTRRS